MNKIQILANSKLTFMLIFKSHPWIINCVLNTQISLTVCSQSIVPKTVRLQFLCSFFSFLQNFYCHPLLHFSTKARVYARQAAPCTSLYLHTGKTNGTRCDMCFKCVQNSSRSFIQGPLSGELGRRDPGESIPSDKRWKSIILFSFFFFPPG